MIALELLAAWLFADFLAGVVHWIEDKVFVKTTMHILTGVVKDNELHHVKPTAMLSHSWWGNISTGVVIAWPFSLALWLFGAPTVLWLSVFFASFGNLVHRFAHMPRAKVPRLVRILQCTGLFITFKQHAEHHYEGRLLLSKESAHRRYCPMTTWLNPLLDRVGFFRGLEWLIGLR